MLPAITSPAAKTFDDGRPACMTTRAHSSTVTPRYVKVIPGRSGYAQNGGRSIGSAQWLFGGSSASVRQSSRLAGSKEPGRTDRLKASTVAGGPAGAGPGAPGGSRRG